MMFEIEDNLSINLSNVESVSYNPNTSCIHIKMTNNNYYDLEDNNESYYEILIRYMNNIL